ncbi:phosphodiester glycosidase family protein [Streptomyces uncialis]|uniref:phosphodiester glycosidase family protein n=1 Tax=Streptomyces uncialis TaxID=1048205 RepID=UPI00386D6867
MAVGLTCAALTGTALSAAPQASGAQAGEAFAGAAKRPGSVKVHGAPPGAHGLLGVTERIATGVTYRHYDIGTPRGTTHAHLLTVDLGDPGVKVDLLYPSVVGGRATVSSLANTGGAIAGVNGDFFNITEAQHPGVSPTYAPVGPAIAAGRELKAAVPRKQRFGPSLPPGTSTEDVLGVDTDGRARLDRLRLDGAVTTPGGTLKLHGLNQYALKVGSVGAFTADWGSRSRVRATCGSDTKRGDPCSDETHEVTVRGGEVVATRATPGDGRVLQGTTVLVGREAGARELRKLSVGDRVTVRHRLVPSVAGVAYRFAIGGHPVLRDGAPLSGLDTSASAVRTAVGIDAAGRRLLLFAVDGASAYRKGLTMAELARELRDAGADDGFNLDGGGSSTLAARKAGATRVTVRNHPSDGSERMVANGIGVFATG